MKNPLTPAGIEPVTFRFVAQHLNHCATAVHTHTHTHTHTHIYIYIHVPTSETLGFADTEQPKCAVSDSVVIIDLRKFNRLDFVKEMHSVLCEVENKILNFISDKFQTGLAVAQIVGCRPTTTDNPSSNPSPAYVTCLMDTVVSGQGFCSGNSIFQRQCHPIITLYWSSV